MKKLLLAGIAALLVFGLPWEPLPLLAAEYSDDGVPARFQPWERVWQCNDIRVTATGPQPGVTVYDLGGTIWGGSQFTLVPGKGLELDLYFNGRPCVPLR